MRLSEWLRQFQDLHERAKQGMLEAPALADYRAARDELGRVLLCSEHIALEPGQRRRRMLRTARALPADIEFRDVSLSAITRQVSAGGFSALLARLSQVDEDVKVVLRIPGSRPLQSRARVVDVRQQARNAHVSFQLVGLDESDAERLKVFVLDDVLGQLQN